MQSAVKTILRHPLSLPLQGEGTTAPDKMDAQTTAPLPDFTEPGTENGKTAEPQEAESSTPTVTPDPKENHALDPWFHKAYGDEQNKIQQKAYCSERI